MPGARRRGVLPRRRRRDDDGEDESSTAGDIDELSISEGSAISNVEDDADAEGSEISADDEDSREPAGGAKTNVKTAANRAGRVLESSNNVDSPGTTQDLTNTVVTPNGNGKAEQQDHNGLTQTQADKAIDGAQNLVATDAPQAPNAHETVSDRARREHQEYIKQRNSNPAFVPNRGGFFLHDDRTAASSSPYGRPYQRGRGRGYNQSFGVG